jgi:hypothetical protein
MLRWLLVLAVLAGAGILQGSDCLPPTPRGTALITDSTAVAASAAHLGTAEFNGHAHRAAGSDAHRTHSTAGDCHLQTAPGTAATTTSSTVAPPTTAIRLPSVPAPVPVGKPRTPVAVALTEIGISRI